MENKKSFIIELRGEDFQNELTWICPEYGVFTEEEIGKVMQKFDEEYLNDTVGYAMEGVDECVSNFIKGK